jgi:hypothetical protein
MKNLFYLSVLCLLAFAGCKKKSDPSPANNTTTNNTQNQTGTTNNDPTSTATYYLVFFDGANSIKLEQSVGGIYNGSESSGGLSFIETGGVFDVLENYAPIYKGNITFGKNYGTFPDRGMVYNAFSTGANTYGHETAQTTGFIMGYKDANNVFWSTNYGVGTQSGSAVNISSISTYNANSLVQTYDVQGTFNCTVYDQNGNSKTLTNGKFKSMFPYNY